MKNKINIHNFWRSDAFIILMFAVMSVLSATILWYGHFVNVRADLAFHWKRIYEIHDSILQGNVIPKVSINTFNQTGSAVMSLYPNLNIYSMAIFSFFIKSFVNLYYLIWILRNLFSLLVGYYACRSFLNNKKISFIFSVVYTISTVTLYLQSNFLYGMTASVIFMPLVLFGILNLLEKNDWIELSLGMSAIILCHIIDTLIILLFLFMFAIINYKKVFIKNTLKALSKAVLSTILVTSIFWLPSLILMGTNNIGMPPLPSHNQISGQPLKAFLSPVVNHVRPFLSLASLLGLILGVLLYKKLTNYCKQFLWISIVFLLLCSNLFPWSLFHHTVVEGILQTTFRLFIIPELLLSYILSEIVIEMFNSEKKKIIALDCIIMVALLTQLIGQLTLLHGFKNYTILNHGYDGVGDYVVSGNTSFDYLMSGYNRLQYDYYPKSSIKMYDTINHNVATLDGNKHMKMKLLGNGGYEFSNRSRVKNLALPFLYYNGINYQVKLDGKTVNGSANENSLMTIKNVNKGQHHVRIIVHNTEMQIISYVTSLVVLIILLGAIIKKYIKQ